VLLGAWGLAGSAQQASSLRTTVFDRTIQPGEVVRLDVTCECQARRATATVFGRDVPLFPVGHGNGWQALIGIDLDVTPGTYPIAVVVEQAGQPAITATHQLLVVPKRFPVRRVSVPARFVNPPEDAIGRIRDEAERLQTLFETLPRPRQWDGPFQPPVAAPTSGSFGTRSIFNGQPRSPHSGVDFRAAADTPVAAPGAGVVAIAEPFFFTGNTVVIDHGLGLYSLLAHLSKFAVKEGDRVQRGQVVGFVGATGRASGPHLHWSVRLNGARVDPLSLVAVTKE
jgi:murein DD-endopeptidase MepM/ murein hydrolase activator NlpD